MNNSVLSDTEAELFNELGEHVSRWGNTLADYDPRWWAEAVSEMLYTAGSEGPGLRGEERITVYRAVIAALTARLRTYEEQAAKEARWATDSLPF